MFTQFIKYPRRTMAFIAVSLCMGVTACSPVANKDNNSTAAAESIAGPTWERVSSNDPMTNKVTYAAIAKSIDYETRKPTNGSLTIACNTKDKDKFSVAIASGYPVKTAGFSSIGGTGRYSIKIGDGQPLKGIADLAANNTVLVLTDEDSSKIVPLLEGSDKLLIQLTTVTDSIVTEEVDISGFNNEKTVLKQNCATPK